MIKKTIQVENVGSVEFEVPSVDLYFDTQVAIAELGSLPEDPPPALTRDLYKIWTPWAAHVVSINGVSVKETPITILQIIPIGSAIMAYVLTGKS